MGRKIPARKHHGIRDPIKQAEERFEKMKDKIDNPPTKANDQKISNNFARFIKLKNSAKIGKMKKIRSGIEDFPRAKPNKKKNKIINIPRRTKSLPDFKQKADESDRMFMHRVNATTKQAMIEANYEAKYGVDVVRNKKTGEISVKTRSDEFLKNKNNKQKTQLTSQQKVLIKEQIKKMNDKKKEEKEGKYIEFRKDNIKFGEVVHGPPNISTIPRKAEKTDAVSRPGQKNLLLKPLVKPLVNEEIADYGKKKKIENGKIDKTGKRKDLPTGTRAMLEQEREKTIEMYRLMKKNKLKQINDRS